MACGSIKSNQLKVETKSRDANIQIDEFSSLKTVF
jgi:hypothetical protein